jgi:hypothetical protein
MMLRGRFFDSLVGHKPIFMRIQSLTTPMRKRELWYGVVLAVTLGILGRLVFEATAAGYENASDEGGVGGILHGISVFAFGLLLMGLKNIAVLIPTSLLCLYSLCRLIFPIEPQTKRNPTKTQNFDY